MNNILMCITANKSINGNDNIQYVETQRRTYIYIYIYSFDWLTNQMFTHGDVNDVQYSSLVLDLVSLVSQWSPVVRKDS